MDAEVILCVRRSLQRVALNRGVLPYAKFHAMFARSVPLVQRYQALEVAISAISEVSHIDYGVLLACDSGLPGPDFFKRFRKHRFDDYVAFLGDPRFCRQSRKQQRVLIESERRRVYAHANTLVQFEGQRESAGPLPNAAPLESVFQVRGAHCKPVGSPITGMHDPGGTASSRDTAATRGSSSRVSANSSGKHTGLCSGGNGV
jgi:hypothetical protein